MFSAFLLLLILSFLIPRGFLFFVLFLFARITMQIKKKDKSFGAGKVTLLHLENCVVWGLLPGAWLLGEPFFLSAIQACQRENFVCVCVHAYMCADSHLCAYGIWSLASNISIASHCIFFKSGSLI